MREAITTIILVCCNAARRTQTLSDILQHFIQYLVRFPFSLGAQGCVNLQIHSRQFSCNDFEYEQKLRGKSRGVSCSLNSGPSQNVNGSVHDPGPEVCLGSKFRQRAVIAIESRKSVDSIWHLDSDPNVLINAADIRFIDSYKRFLNGTNTVFHLSAAQLESSCRRGSLFVYFRHDCQSVAGGHR